MTPLPVWVHELVVAPLAVGLAYDHARRALGAGRALVEMLALAGYGYLLERVAIAVFSSHDYRGVWCVAPGGVPLAVAGVWAAVIVSVLTLATRCGRRGLGRAGAAALFGIALDLLMEPVAVRAGLWSWTPAGGWLGVPIGNFIGWAVIVGTYSAGAERSSSASHARAVGARALLALACVAALVAVGLAWRRFDVEASFTGGRAWAFWVAVLLAGALAAGRSPLRVGSSFGDRLAAASGRGPEAVVALLTVVFAIDALGTGARVLLLPVLGSAAILWRAAAASSAGTSSGS